MNALVPLRTSALSASTGAGGRPREFPGPFPQAADGTAEARERMEFLAWLMDSAFRVPGTQWRFGLDAVAGVIPGLGDVVTNAVGGWIVWEAYRLGVPKHLLGRMLGNVALDTVLGSVSLVGDVWDFWFKASKRNMALLREHLEGGLTVSGKPA